MFRPWFEKTVAFGLKKKKFNQIHILLNHFVFLLKHWSCLVIKSCPALLGSHGL